MHDHDARARDTPSDHEFDSRPPKIRKMHENTTTNGAVRDS